MRRIVAAPCTTLARSMSLDALAPDQRAVVQLVLQQDRSYDELAGLLGISAEAVRERAHKGLERLAPAAGLDAGERAGVADYLLGQQDDAQAESTRSLLASSPPARAGARAAAAARAGVPPSPLPDTPAAPPQAAQPAPEAPPAAAAESDAAPPEAAAVRA